METCQWWDRNLLDPCSSHKEFLCVRITAKKWLIVIGLAQSTRPCTFGGFEKISILRVDPAPDQSPASEVRRRTSGSPIIVGYKYGVIYRDRFGP